MLCETARVRGQRQIETQAFQLGLFLSHKQKKDTSKDAFKISVIPQYYSIGFR